MTKTEKKNDKNDESAAAIAQLTANNQQLQETAQGAISQLQNYMALTSQYEKTINILSGRIEEFKMQIGQLQQQLQQLQQQQD